MRVADRTVVRCGNSIFIRTDDTDNFKSHTIIIEVLKALFGLTKIDIKTCRRIIIPAITRKNRTELEITDLLIRPVLIRELKRLLIHCSLHHFGDLLLGLQTKSIESIVVKFVVLIEEKNDLIVLFRPAAIYNIILLVCNGVCGLTVFTRKKFTPKSHRASHQLGRLGILIGHTGHIDIKHRLCILTDKRRHQFVSI